MAPKDRNQAKTLFQEYQRYDGLVNNARESLEKALSSRSDAVREIVKGLGKGPFKWNNEVIKAVSRETKDESGTVTKTTFFFKTMGSEVQEID
jgi:hypothetical protein